MSASPSGRPDGPPRYEIRLRGHLDPRWTAWFDGLSLANDSDGSTVLTGPVADQAALHGVLQKVRDAGLPLISVALLDAEKAPSSTRRSRQAPRTQHSSPLEGN